MNGHFYVEHAGMIADGLREIGSYQGDYTPQDIRQIEGLAGATPRYP